VEKALRFKVDDVREDGSKTNIIFLWEKLWRRMRCCG
jgi:hypothetical protein